MWIYDEHGMAGPRARGKPDGVFDGGRRRVLQPVPLLVQLEVVDLSFFRSEAYTAYFNFLDRSGSFVTLQQLCTLKGRNDQ